VKERERERERERKGMKEKAAHAHVSEIYTYEYLRISFHDVTKWRSSGDQPVPLLLKYFF